MNRSPRSAPTDGFRGSRRRTPQLLVPLVLLIACGCAGGQAGRVAPSTSSPEPTASVQAATEFGAPVPDSGAGLSCKVPISGFNPGTGGFVTFPGGKFVLDQASNVPLPANTVLTGGYTFDRAVSRWLPVPWDWVTPDGSRYAYTDRAGAVHVVDVASGSDRSLDFAQGAVAIKPDEKLVVLDFSKEGIYLMAAPASGGFPHGLWLADPAGGGVRQLTDQGSWQRVNNGAIWGNPTPGAGAGAQAGGDSLARLDLKAQAIGSWYQRAGTQLIVVGFDGDHPLAMISTPASTEIWAFSGPSNGMKVYAGPGQDAPGALHLTGPGVWDSHGLWLGSPEGLLLYSGGGLKRLSTATGWVGGACS